MAIQNPPSRLGNPGNRGPQGGQQGRGRPAPQQQPQRGFGGRQQQQQYDQQGYDDGGDQGYDAQPGDEYQDQPQQRQQSRGFGGGQRQQQGQGGRQQQGRQQQGRGRVNRDDPMAGMDDHEYNKGPEKIFNHIGEHIVLVQNIAEGTAPETGNYFFGLTGVIEESTNLAAGTPVRDSKTLDNRYPKYFFDFVAERVAAIGQALGEQMRPEDVKTADTRALTGGPDAPEGAGFDFAATEVRLRLVVAMVPKKDRAGKPTGEMQSKVSCYPA